MRMIVTCSQCSTKFKIADEKITASGVKVRCSKCKHTFVVQAGGVLEVGNAAAAPAPPAATASPAPDPGLKFPPPGAASMPDELPDDIFSTPTKVGPPPAGAGPFSIPPPPLPPPPMVPPGVGPPRAPTEPPAKGKPPAAAASLPGDVVASIDLDSDLPIMDADALPRGARDPLPLPPPPKASAVPKPAPAAAKPAPPAAKPAPSGTGASAQPSPTKAAASGGLGAELFADLDAAVDRQFAPAASPAASSASVEDPFAGVDFDLPSPAAGGQPASALGDPFAGLAPGAGPGLADSLGAPDSSADDPFADLETVTKPAAASPPPAPPGGSDEDPFAGIDLHPDPSPAIAGPQMADDPFGGIDLAPGAGTSEPDDDPFGQVQRDTASRGSAGREEDLSPPAASSGDLFGDLGDPFGGLESAGDSGAQPPPLPASKAPAIGAGDDLFALDSSDAESQGTAGLPSAAGDDPFASLDVGGADGMDPNVGHDPFASLDSSVGDDGGDLDLGMQLSADGSLIGEALPAGPRPTKTISPGAEQLPAPAVTLRPPGPPPMALGPSGQEESRRGTSLGMKIGFGLVLAILALFVFIIYRSGGKPDLTSWSTYVEAFTGSAAQDGSAGPLRAVDVGTTAYPNRDGHDLVVLWGAVENTSSDALRSIAVTGQLLDPSGKVIEQLTVPTGVRFAPQDVAAMLDRASVAQAYRTRLAGLASELAAGKRIDFMVVLFDHPIQMDGVRVRVTAAVSADPLAGLPPPARPPVVDDAAPPGPAAGEKPPVRPAPGRAAAAHKGTVVRWKPGGAPPAKAAPAAVRKRPGPPAPKAP